MLYAFDLTYGAVATYISYWKGASDLS